MERFENDPVLTTLAALDRRLEHIRQEQLARSRSSLRQLTSEQLQQVEQLTAAIMGKIYGEVASELNHSADKGNARHLSETVSLMLGLA